MIPTHETNFFNYVAGLLDGEACFRWHGGVCIEVQLTYPGILKVFACRFGGKVKKQPPPLRGHKQVYRWTIRSYEAESFLEAMLPFLREKKPQATLLLLMANSTSENAKVMDGSLRGLKRVSYA